MLLRKVEQSIKSVGFKLKILKMRFLVMWMLQILQELLEMNIKLVLEVDYIRKIEALIEFKTMDQMEIDEELLEVFQFTKVVFLDMEELSQQQDTMICM
jgi:hypothetical protein